MDQQQRITLGVAVRNARKAQGLTNNDLAAKAGVAPGTITRAETGQSVRTGNLHAIIDTLGVSLPQSDPTQDEATELAVDIVRKWLQAIEDPAERTCRMQELIRWIVITKG